MGSLIETITGDANLLRKLAQTPADEQTRTFEFNGSIDSDVEPFLVDGKPDVKPSEGFVPHRHITSLGGACVDEAPNAPKIEYRLIGKLGSGGTAVVYQAHQRAIDREVAVKLLRDELADDPQHRQRFLTEARVIGAMDHPNVIALHDLCVDDGGRLFYSMKRIDGASWEAEIDTLDTEANIDVLLRVADAIRYAHSRGLIHRDLKPENIMLGKFGEVLVADWGLAMGVDAATIAPADNAGLRARWTGSAVGGTPAYMAPEQAAGRLNEITPATDVYLLGAILYRILTGRPPHAGENLLACIQAAANNHILPVKETGAWMDVAMTAMATQPGDRYQTVQQFVDAIRDQRSHEESCRLERRAMRHLEESAAVPTPDDVALEAMEINPYRRFRIAEALLRESIEVWPGNRSAAKHLQQVQIDFARLAASRGDFDLALLLYRTAGQQDSEAAARVRRELTRRNELKEDRTKYSTLFTQSPDAGLLIRWVDGVVLEANTACLEMLGYRKDELVGEALAAIELWACPERRGLFLDRLRQDGRVDNFETVFNRKGVAAQSCVDATDPNRIDVLISARRVDLAGEQLLLSTLRDISPRKAAERDLRQSRRRLRDLQQLAGLGSWSYNVLDQTVTWSEETFKVAGRAIDRGEPSYNEFMQSIHPDDRSTLAQAIAHAIDDSASYDLVVRMQDESGGYRRLFTRGQPVPNDAGVVVEVYGILMPAMEPAPTK